MSPSSEMPISTIKIRIPPKRREVITRSRLVDQLYDQLDKLLLFVIAPAGYGKTSLLSDFAAQTEMPVCWLSLDALDQDPQRFLRYLIAAIAERFPAFGQDSLAMLESMTSLSSDQEQILVTLTNEINLRVRDHFVLMLDDFHMVEEAAAIGQLIGRFLQLSGENVHLILSSRNLPDFPASPLLIARNQVGGISFQDLSFQVQEIQELFRHNKGIELSWQDAESMLRETEGWVAAIHLSNGLPNSLPQFHPLSSTAVLFDFFSREVMDHQPESIKRFMRLTSIFDAFDAELCERVLAPLVTDNPLEWADLFRQVQSAANLFSMPLDKEGRWMRYHHLFQHFLRSQLQYEDPALAWSIQQNLARIYEEDRKWEEALQIYDRLTDHQNQIRLLIETGMSFIGAGRILTLDTWLKKIPVDLAYTQPSLISLMGAVYSTQGDQRQALSLLDQSESGLRHSGNQFEWIMSLLRRAEVHRQLGQFESALKDIDQIQEMIKDTPVPVYAESQRIRGLALFGLGRVRDSLPWLEDSLLRYRQLGMKNHIPILETELGVVHRRLGEVQIAARYYASALESLAQAGNTGWKARLLNNMGMLKYMTGQLEEAHQLLQEAVQTAKQCGYVRIQTNALISLGDLLCDLNDLDSAFDCYDLALTQATHLGHSMYIFYAELGEARLKRMRGDSLAAIAELRQVELSQVRLGSYEQALFNQERGLCLLDAGKIEEAVSALGISVSLFEEGGNQAEQSIARLWHKTASIVSTPQLKTSELLELLPPQRDWRTPIPLMIHGGRVANWLKSIGQQRLLRDSSLRLFFEHAIRILNSLPAVSSGLKTVASNPSQQAPRLEITSFGTVAVMSDGHTVELSDWQTREARDLFFYLLQSPPRTKEQIAMDFWPDISPARLKVRFRINIYRIRQALGQDVILFKDDHYSFNRSIPFQWDRERVDELHQSSQRRTNIDERIKELENALTLIRGNYLADLEAKWAEADRIQYGELRKTIMLELSELHLQRGHTQHCLNMARELISLDPLMESANRVALQAYAAKHDPAGLALHYRQYQEILENELGMLPSLEMRNLYEKLLASI
jgi:ATP/maltotriose-dependent transcriptional regulator MalT/two-component SAPR family response regulator